MKLKQTINITKWVTRFNETYITREAKWTSEGRVVGILGDTIKVEFTIFQLGFLRLWKKKWFNVTDPSCTFDFSG